MKLETLCLHAGQLSGTWYPLRLGRISFPLLARYRFLRAILPTASGRDRRYYHHFSLSPGIAYRVPTPFIRGLDDRPDQGPMLSAQFALGWVQSVRSGGALTLGIELLAQWTLL